MNETELINKLQPLVKNDSPKARLKLPTADLKALLMITNRYRTLYDIGKLISSEMKLAPLLNLVMDKVIEVTNAQRGFIALVDDKQKLDFRSARHLENSDIQKPKFEVSRGIIQEVIDKGETIFSPNAMADPRFGVRKSVMRLQLLSVLCVPIEIDERIAGVIYLDNLDQPDIFDESIAELLTAFAQHIAIALKNALQFSSLEKSQQELADELRGRYHFEAIIGSGKNMTEVLRLVAAVADNDASVLITGETGTGKGLIAQALHYNSSRSNKRMITINCGAIPENLIESELFGHVKGSFTGAINDKRGKFEAADGSTIFLDEIGELSPAMQVKLLHVLQDGCFSPLGSDIEKRTNVRVLAATHRDLNELLQTGAFREDLYYRLNVVNIEIPALHERREDIPLLVEHFLKKYNTSGKHLHFSKAAEDCLMHYNYPGNIRELENLIRRAIIFCNDETIDVTHLPKEIMSASAPLALAGTQEHNHRERLKQHIETWEKTEFINILIQKKGKIRESARCLGIDPSDFHKKLKRHGIDPGDYKT